MVTRELISTVDSWDLRERGQPEAGVHFTVEELHLLAALIADGRNRGTEAIDAVRANLPAFLIDRYETGAAALAERIEAAAILLAKPEPEEEPPPEALGDPAPDDPKEIPF